MGIIADVKLRLFKNRWKKFNSNNHTIPSHVFDAEYVEVGAGTYGTINVYQFNKQHKVVIGNYCSIAKNVMFIVDADHYLRNISTYPFKTKAIKSEKYEAISKGDIIVQDDIWIGYRAIILSGVTIGQGAVIAAGAVVASDVPPYAIVGGVSAKVIKYRFSQEVIDFLLTLDYSQLTEELIKKHIDDLYKPIDEMSLKDIKMLYGWFPKKQTTGKTANERNSFAGWRK